MLSDEEKQAIEEFKKLKDYKQIYYGYAWFKVEVCADDEMKQNIDIILNLVKKQSKEIEGLIKVSKECIEEKFNNDQKWEDKIKAKIEELDKEEKEQLKGTKGQDRYAIKQEYMYKRSSLQSLLEKE